MVHNGIGSNYMEVKVETQMGLLSSLYLVVICGLSVGIGLGEVNRLTYHEAFIAQGAREILASGCWWYPTIGGQPWLEKPPVPFWLVAGLGWCVGEVSPLVARIPSALATVGLVLGISSLARRRYGLVVGILTGAIQATTAWTVLRGRLAEADILLACSISWALLAFDHLRTTELLDRQHPVYVRRFICGDGFSLGSWVSCL